MKKSNPSQEVSPDLERQAWNLRCRCFSYGEIADKLGISEKAVARMLKRVGERLTRAIEQQLPQMRAEQNGQLQHILREALHAWEACQQTALPPETPSEELPEPRPKQGVAYLKVALQALSNLRALWGLEAAKKAELTTAPPVVKTLIGVDINRIGVKQQKPPPDLPETSSSAYPSASDSLSSVSPDPIVVSAPMPVVEPGGSVWAGRVLQ